MTGSSITFGWYLFGSRQATASCDLAGTKFVQLRGSIPTARRQVWRVQPRAAAAVTRELAMAMDGWNPTPDPRSVIVCESGESAAARFTVLTDRLVRMEWSPDGRFEDRASQVFVNRRLTPPEFKVERDGMQTRITTSRLALSFWGDGKAFHRDNLRVEFDLNGARARWRPGTADVGNLGGTTRTLDMVDGACPVEPGLLSRDGWVIVDDSQRLVFQPAEKGASGVASWDWMAPRNAPPGAIDWYIFAYGRDYKAALKDYTRVAGRIPLPPRYVFGSWWSRYWAYTEEELIGLVEEFRLHDVPVDVLVIDMDWHLDGWTGYTWNPEYFPDPERFLCWTDTHGLQITLNLHPADGVGAHESAFIDVCRDMGLDPKQTALVPFDSTDPRFLESYFQRLHWPLEKMGVDFWWMDWQQGNTTRIPGLDPLWWLNHAHWEDLKRREVVDPIRRGRRPLVFSRWGGLGNHRYPIGFSGDTYSTWKSLAWQPPFTAMAGNVGYAYWSHDIGGHQPGPVDPELYARWVQFGALSPVLRTHTSKNPLGERRIWTSPRREFRTMREAFRLRYALIPYIYTASRRCYDEGIPLCRPLYLHWPRIEESYRRPGQYLFGDDLLAAPVTEPGDATGRSAATTVWLPPGSWTHWYTGETIEGPCERELLTPVDQIPLFAGQGAIIPTAPPMRWSSEKPLEPLLLHVFPGQSGSTRLYEDDGEAAAYQSGACAWTPIEMRRDGRMLTLSIGRAEGAYEGMLEKRSIDVRLRDQWPATGVVVEGTLLARSAPGSDVGWWYDRSELAIVIRLPHTSVRHQSTIEVALSGSDEASLRAGLRGWMHTLERVATLLGSRAPVELTEALRVVREAPTDDNFAPIVSGLVAMDVWQLATAVAAINLRDDGALTAARDEAICLLLGLSCRVEIDTDGTAAGQLRTRATARLMRGQGIELSTVVEASRPWKARDAVTSVRTLASGPTIIGSEQTWQTERTLQHTMLRAQVSVRSARAEQEEIRLYFNQSVLPSINGWWVVGPFDAPFGPKQLNSPFEPERTVDLSASYAGGGGRRISWKRIERRLASGDDPRCEFVVDLHKALGAHYDDAVAYALTRIRSAEDGPAVLALGSDDGVVVWVDGVEVHRHQVQRGYGSKQDRVPITLRRGTNTILLKVGQADGAWAFGAHLDDQDGQALTGVEVMLDGPPMP